MGERLRIKAWILPQWASFRTTLQWLALRSHETRVWPWRLEHHIFSASTPSFWVLLVGYVLPQRNSISLLRSRSKSRDPFAKVASVSSLYHVVRHYEQVLKLFKSQPLEITQNCKTYYGELCSWVFFSYFIQLCFPGPLSWMELQVTQTVSRGWLKPEPLLSTKPLQLHCACLLLSATALVTALTCTQRSNRGKQWSIYEQRPSNGEEEPGFQRLPGPQCPKWDMQFIGRFHYALLLKVQRRAWKINCTRLQD